MPDATPAVVAMAVASTAAVAVAAAHDVQGASPAPVHAVDPAPRPEPQAAPAEAVQADVAPVVAAPVPAPAPAPAPVVTPLPPKAAEPIVMRQSIDDVLAERRSMLESAGLALVETDAGKWRAAYDRAAQYVEPPRAPRVKRPAPVIDHGPLVLVETRKA